MNYPWESIRSIKVMAIDDMRMVKYSIKKMGRKMYFIDRGVVPDRRNFGIGKCEKNDVIGCDEERRRGVCV
jgi:hypothetical protein